MTAARTTLASVIALLVAPSAASAASGGQPPAGGAAIGQVIVATAGATVATAILIAIIAGHRSGRITWLAKVAKLSERDMGLPGWAALPATVLGISLLIAVFGMYWDISLHLDNGRDPGPLANPAHYFILVGLFGVFVCGALSIALAQKRPSGVAVRLAYGWWAPLGTVLILVCSAVSLIAFPLDDIWHRIFGQDVTLWGPTHLLLFGGASFSLIGLWVLQVEGAKEKTGENGNPPSRTLIQQVRDLSIAGGLLVGMSTFQGEFEFGVPQFQLVWQPVLLALAAGVALVAARIRLGRGGALKAALFFIALRGGIALIVGPILGQTTPHFPLYLAEAACVELAALRVSPRRPIAFGALSGALIGSVGYFAEDLWSHIFGRMPWPSSMVVEGLVLALVTGIAAGVIGGFIGRSLTPDVEREPAARFVVPGAALAVVAVVAFLLPMPVPSNPPSANIVLTPAGGGGAIHDVNVTATLHPASAAKGARWLVATAWQGGGAVVTRFDQVAPGVYRSEKPIPIGGSKWKSTLRLQRGREVLGLPIYMPEDKAIPAAGIPAPAQFTRPFEQDKKLLQREQKPGVSSFLTGGAYLVVLLVGLLVIGLLTWGLRRIGREIGTTPPPRTRTTGAKEPAGVAPAT